MSPFLACGFPTTRQCLVLVAALLAAGVLPAASPTPSPALQLTEALFPPARQKELLYKACDSAVEKAKAKGLSAAGQEELRAALVTFMDQLVADRVLVAPLAAQLGDKFTEEELVTAAAFFQTTAGQKFANGSLKGAFDRERLQQATKEALRSRATEFAAVLKEIMQKHGRS